MISESGIPIAPFGLNITVSKPVFVTCSNAEFHVNFNPSIIVLCTFLSNILIMANLEIPTMNGPSIFVDFCSFGFKINCSLGKNGIDLFKKLKHDSCEFIIPSNSNIFFILITWSTFSCISDTNVWISNLCPCISIIIGIINNTLTNCPYPT